MTVSCFSEVKGQVCDQEGESQGWGQALHAGHCSKCCLAYHWSGNGKGLWAPWNGRSQVAIKLTSKDLLVYSHTCLEKVVGEK